MFLQCLSTPPREHATLFSRITAAADVIAASPWRAAGCWRKIHSITSRWRRRVRRKCSRPSPSADPPSQLSESPVCRQSAKMKKPPLGLSCSPSCPRQARLRLPGVLGPRIIATRSSSPRRRAPPQRQPFFRLFLFVQSSSPQPPAQPPASSHIHHPTICEVLPLLYYLLLMLTVSRESMDLTPSAEARPLWALFSCCRPPSPAACCRDEDEGESTGAGAPFSRSVSTTSTTSSKRIVVDTPSTVATELSVGE